MGSEIVVVEPDLWRIMSGVSSLRFNVLMSSSSDCSEWNFGVLCGVEPSAGMLLLCDCVDVSGFGAFAFNCWCWCWCGGAENAGCTVDAEDEAADPPCGGGPTAIGTRSPESALLWCGSGEAAVAASDSPDGEWCIALTCAVVVGPARNERILAFCGDPGGDENDEKLISLAIDPPPPPPALLFSSFIDTWERKSRCSRATTRRIARIIRSCPSVSR